MKATRLFPTYARSWRWLAVVLAMFALWSPQAEARKKKDKSAAAQTEQDAGRRKAETTEQSQDGEKQAKRAAAPAANTPAATAEKPESPRGRAAATVPAQHTLPPATGPPVVPGGGLQAHEKAGGHLISRHVGKTESDLIQRLRGEHQIVYSSSFTSLPVAEAVTGLLISRRRQEITAWLKGREERLAIDFTVNKPVGISVSRRTWKAEPVRGVRLILTRDAGFPGGWRILTGYPQT